MPKASLTVVVKSRNQPKFIEIKICRTTENEPAASTDAANEWYGGFPQVPSNDPNCGEIWW